MKKNPFTFPVLAAGFCCAALCPTNSGAQLRHSTAQAPQQETLGDLLREFHRGIDRPELSHHYYEHLVRVKFPDRFRVRLREGEPVDLTRDSTLEPGTSH